MEKHKSGPSPLLHHSRRTPALHGWIEVKLKEVFEGDYVDCGLIVGTERLYARWYDDVNPRLKHGLQIAHRNSFIDRGEEKPKPPRALGHDLAPAFPKRSLDREDNRVRRIPVEVLDRRKNEIRLTIYDWLGCEGIAKADKELPDEQLKRLPRPRPTPLCEPEKEPIKRGEIPAEYFDSRASGRERSSGPLRSQKIAIATLAVRGIEDSLPAPPLCNNL